MSNDLESRIKEQDGGKSLALSDPLSAGVHGAQLLYIAKALAGEPVQGVELIKHDDALKTLQTIMAIYQSVEYSMPNVQVDAIHNAIHKYSPTAAGMAKKLLHR